MKVQSINNQGRMLYWDSTRREGGYIRHFGYEEKTGTDHCATIDTLILPSGRIEIQVNGTTLEEFEIENVNLE